VKIVLSVLYFELFVNAFVFWFFGSKTRSYPKSVAKGISYALLIHGIAASHQLVFHVGEGPA
jgi:hypothetical protein